MDEMYKNFKIICYIGVGIILFCALLTFVY